MSAPKIEDSVSPPTVLDFDPAATRRDLNRKGFKIGHRLVDDPLFSLPALIELSRKLPVQDVEYNAGDLPVDMDPAATPKTGLTIEETIRRIEECGSWMVMKFVERVPEYRRALDRCLDEIEGAIAPEGLRTIRREAFIFISSPRSVTPYHFDPEYNFLLQIRGTKTVYLFPRSLLTEEEIEDRFTFRHRNLKFHQSYQSRAEAFVLSPGSGIHIPIAAPHWVKNGAGVSISFSITFRTEESEREAALYRFNSKLRARGLRPAPVHSSPVRDSLKLATYRGLRLALRPAKMLLARRNSGEDGARR
jgi:Cupin-like domain